MRQCAQLTDDSDDFGGSGEAICFAICRWCIIAPSRSRSFCNWISSCDTTCIWTLACAVDRSSNVCSVFKCLQYNFTIPDYTIIPRKPRDRKEIRVSEKPRKNSRAILVTLPFTNHENPSSGDNGTEKIKLRRVVDKGGDGDANTANKIPYLRISVILLRRRNGRLYRRGWRWGRWWGAVGRLTTKMREGRGSLSGRVGGGRKGLDWGGITMRSNVVNINETKVISVFLFFF